MEVVGHSKVILESLLSSLQRKPKEQSVASDVTIR